MLAKPRDRVVVGAMLATVLVVALAAVAVFYGLRGPTRRVADQAPATSAPASTAPASPTDSPTPEDSPTPPPSPSPTPPRKAAPAAPAKKKAPPPPPKAVPVNNAPPPVSHQPAGAATCPSPSGANASRSQVAAALSAASAHAFKPTLTADDSNPPAISVRLALIQGVAWEESCWLSTIVSSDGGIGTMQVMPATVDWMNQKYGTTYTATDLTGNVMIGTGYLAWLVRYFGDKYFNGNYSLAGDPNKLVLLDLVISGYQAGFGAVDTAMAAKADLPNTWYVYTVEGFMTNQPWAG